MIKIKLRLSSWVAAKLGDEHSGWLTLEKEVGEDSTISDFLAGMVMAYPGFRETVYNPDAGLVNEQAPIADAVSLLQVGVHQLLTGVIVVAYFQSTLHHLIASLGFIALVIEVFSVSQTTANKFPTDFIGNVVGQFGYPVMQVRNLMHDRVPARCAIG